MYSCSHFKIRFWRKRVLPFVHAVFCIRCVMPHSTSGNLEMECIPLRFAFRKRSSMYRMCICTIKPHRNSLTLGNPGNAIGMTVGGASFADSHETCYSGAKHGLGIAWHLCSYKKACRSCCCCKGVSSITTQPGICFTRGVLSLQKPAVQEVVFETVAEFPIGSWHFHGLPIWTGLFTSHGEFFGRC